MDLLFLSLPTVKTVGRAFCFNPYSNGSSFFIISRNRLHSVRYTGFNPYSNGSSFFITQPEVDAGLEDTFQSLF